MKRACTLPNSCPVNPLSSQQQCCVLPPPTTANATMPTTRTTGNQAPASPSTSEATHPCLALHLPAPHPCLALHLRAPHPCLALDLLAPHRRRVTGPLTYVGHPSCSTCAPHRAHQRWPSTPFAVANGGGRAPLSLPLSNLARGWRNRVKRRRLCLDRDAEEINRK